MKQNNKIKKEFSAIILAAGKSERLGFPKLSLKYDENNTFLQQIVNAYYSFGCKEICIVVNETGSKYLIENHIKFYKNVQFVINQHPEWHRFYSLKIGARSLSEVKPTFIHNVDNPFVNHQVLNRLVDDLNNSDYISPEFKGKGGHPILLSERIINDVRLIHEDKIHFKEFLDHYSKIKVEVNDERVLANINTVEEYNKYFSV